MDILTDYNKSRQCINLESLCHAPDVSMYFGRDGHVSACCYNRVSSFGKYPEQSIEEIWNSATRINMRDSLKRNEFPTGCDSCGKNFYARNFSVNYDNNELLLLLDSLDNKVGLDQAHRVYIQGRTYAHEALIACGRFSASSLVEMLVSG